MTIADLRQPAIHHPETRSIFAWHVSRRAKPDENGAAPERSDEDDEFSIEFRDGKRIERP
jgi:hypothetical protein